MELVPVGKKSLKIKTSKGVIFIGSENLEDAKVVILEDNYALESKVSDDTLVLYGPGDFEASGILIKGLRPEKSTMYTIETSVDSRVLYVESNSIVNLSEENDYQAIIVKAVTPVVESDISSLSSNLVVVFGDEANVGEIIKSKKVNKINLKKLDETNGSVVYLSGK